MNEVRYFVRNSKAGFSIEKCFIPLFELMDGNPDYEIRIFHVPCYHADPISIIRNISYVRRHRSKNGINHITGDIHYTLLGLIGVKSILTIHDLVLIRNAKNKIKKTLFKLLWFKIPCKIANQIVCISKTTMNDLIEMNLISPEKVHVIYNPIEQMFHAQIKELDLKTPVILHIGTNWNKNLNRVVIALKGLKCKLIIIGKINSKTQELLDVNGIRYSNLLNISDEEIFNEYCNCDIVSFPSVYEGFGMPLIEGQATGRPVVTSNINPLIEISGGAAIFVDPTSIESIRKGFLTILENKEGTEEIIRKGIANAKRFSPQIALKKYLRIYRHILINKDNINR